MRVQPRSLVVSGAKNAPFRSIRPVLTLSAAMDPGGSAPVAGSGVGPDPLDRAAEAMGMGMTSQSKGWELTVC